jgi:hypothetical protein
MAVITVDPLASPGSPTAGIQEAIDRLPEGGGTVFLPAGAYLLRRSIRCRSNLTLRGEGPATVLTRPAPLVRPLAESTKPREADIALCDASGVMPGDQFWLCHFRQGGWHSRYLIVTAIEGCRLRCDLLHGDPERTYLVEEKAWAGNYFPAIWVLESRNVTIESLAIDGGDYAYDPEHLGDFVCAAVHARSAPDVRVQNVLVRRWPSDGIGIQGGSGLVTGCIVENCLGIGLHPGTNLGHSVWMGNLSRRNRHGLLFCQGVRNTIVVNNVLIENQQNGIWGLGDPDRYNVVAGNVCAGNGWYGIEAYKGVGNAIVGNVCRENSAASPGTYAGIHLEQHRDNVVVGNVCLDDREKPTQTRGIEDVRPAGPNLVEANHRPETSAYWTTWEELDRKIAAHEAEKKSKA